MWKSLNWVVTSSEKNRRLQLDVSISMLWWRSEHTDQNVELYWNLQFFFRTNYYSTERFSHGVTASCLYFTYFPHHAKLQVLPRTSYALAVSVYFISLKYFSLRCNCLSKVKGKISKIDICHWKTRNSDWNKYYMHFDYFLFNHFVSVDVYTCQTLPDRVTVDVSHQIWCSCVWTDDV